MGEVRKSCLNGLIFTSKWVLEMASYWKGDGIRIGRNPPLLLKENLKREGNFSSIGKREGE
jgi:hypothetical protein